MICGELLKRCYHFQKMQYTPIAFDSVEQNLLWSALVLQSADYEAQEMRLNTDPVPPFFVSIAPLVSGANTGKTYARISVNIELAESALFGNSPIALSAKAVNPGNSAPGHLYQGLTLAGSDQSGSGTPPLILPFNDAEVVIGPQNLPVEGFSVSSITESSVYEKTISWEANSLIKTVVNGITGLSPDVYNSNDPNGAIASTIASEAWTIFCVAALQASDDAEFTIVSTPAGGAVYLSAGTLSIYLNGSTSSEVEFTLDNSAHHVYSIVFDSASWSYFLDGTSLGSGVFGGFSAIAWNSVLAGSIAGNWSISDIIVIPRKLTTAELNAAHAAISSARSIAVATIP